MAFGLTNAPATFQLLMNSVLGPYLRKFALVFFDDILIFSKSLAEHLEHIKLVFEKLREHQLVAKLSKCTFAQEKVEYLGHVITGQGVATDPSKVAAIVQWPATSNVTQLRRFLGLVGYYRRFIQGYGSVCKPVFNALKKDSFSWTVEQQLAFDKVKQLKTIAPVLALPNFSQPFVLETDASGYGLGAVLMQNGKPLSFMSKAIGSKAAALSTYDKEALAIIEALNKWKHYFAASSLIIKTDQESLKYINEQRLTEGVQHKLLIKLLGYNFMVEYKRGKENRTADALCRATHAIMARFSSSAQPAWISDVTANYVSDQTCKDTISQLAVNPTSYPVTALQMGC